MNKGKRVTNKELVERKILIEANRSFFHTLGLHLQFEDGQLVLTHEGPTIHYVGFTDDERAAIAKLNSDAREIGAVRRQMLGFQYQPAAMQESKTITRNIKRAEKELAQVYQDTERLNRRLWPLMLKGDKVSAQERRIIRLTLRGLRNRERELLTVMQAIRGA